MSRNINIAILATLMMVPSPAGPHRDEKDNVSVKPGPN